MSFPVPDKKASQPRNGKASPRSGLHTGLSTILMMLVTLCLTTFGLLSVSTARADLSLTRKSAEHTRDYYAARLKAQQAFALIDNTLLDWQASLSSDVQLQDRLLELRDILEENGFDAGEDAFSVNGSQITVAVLLENEAQKLEIGVAVSPLADFSTRRCTLTSARLVSTLTFDDEVFLDVWEGL